MWIDIKTIVLIAFGYVILIGHLGTYFIVTKMWSMLQFQTGNSKLKPRPWQGQVVGVIDRTLFLIALLIQRPEFLALWLSLKTVSQYKRWSEEEEGRATFNIFLAGNGLSILYSVASYIAIDCFSESDFLTPIIIIVAPVILSAALYIWLRFEENKLIPD